MKLIKTALFLIVTGFILLLLNVARASESSSYEIINNTAKGIVVYSERKYESCFSTVKEVCPSYRRLIIELESKKMIEISRYKGDVSVGDAVVILLGHNKTVTVYKAN